MKRIDSRKFSLLFAFGLALATIVGSTMTAYSQDASVGKTVFEKNCAFCHGLLGEGKVAIPNIAGGTAHLDRLGVPPAVEARLGVLTELVRNGIPSRMPEFPPEMLSDADIANLGSYLMSLPPATGPSIFTANCAMCHGVSGEGLIGPMLNDTPQFVQQMGWTTDQTVQMLGELVHGGIPTRMPSFPAMTDLEVQRLTGFLLDFGQIPAWEAQFAATHGNAPTLYDRYDRNWSLEFAARNGRAPSDADWAAYTSVKFPTPLAGGPGGPPR